MCPVEIKLTDELGDATLAQMRHLFDDAFGSFDQSDWEHAMGGHHVIATDHPGAGEAHVLAHAAIVPRTLWLDGRPVRVGYVEAVATTPRRQRTGLGSRVMEAAAELIIERYELGALSTGSWTFYERLGWQRWLGTSHVRRADGSVERTADEDDGLMVLARPGHTVDLRATIMCAERIGDDW